MSNDYKRVQDALKEGAEPEMLCATCPWDRLCITPPTMTRDEVEKQIEGARLKDEADIEARKAKGEEAGLPMGVIITTLAVGSLDQQAAICPVFSLRLRSSSGRAISDSLRALMQEDQWT